ncbi:MAG: hypothetical protein JNM50_02640 [Chromatiales bacterium]|jgi:signal transduction histidine kinase|nr:hypothetical protein [Chromatiales bacterium]
MDWVTFVWASMAATCLTLALVQFLVWYRDRAAQASLWFAVAAVAVAAIAAGELRLMRSATPAEFGLVQRWTHVPVGVALVALAWFVHQYLGTGRRWLLWTLTAGRGLVLGLNFASPTSVNFQAVTELRGYPLLGQLVSVPVGEPSPWAGVAAASSVLVAVFVTDAAVAAWRRASGRDRERAVLLGAAVVAAILLPTANGLLVHLGFWSAPYFIAVAFMAVVLAMAYELSRDLLQVASLARDLRTSQARLDLAGRAANVGLFTWDVGADRLWATAEGQRLLGLAGPGPFALGDVLATIDAQDRPGFEALLGDVRAGGGDFSCQYRVAGAGAGTVTFWRGVRGQAERGPGGGVQLVRGVVLDITERRRAECEREALREELVHAGRVTMLGQLVATLTHDLSQPLGAIRRNAEAAGLLLGAPATDPGELREIVADIRRDGARAAAVVTRLRALMLRRPMQAREIDVTALVAEVMALLQSEADRRRVRLEAVVPAGLPALRGDPVHLQQVLVNLVMNAFDALEGRADRRVTVAVGEQGGEVELAVLDTGPGVPDWLAERVFEPFFTTRPDGMGMGLAICRTLVDAHGGRIRVDRSVDGGAAIRVVLPVAMPS